MEGKFTFENYIYDERNKDVYNICRKFVEELDKNKDRKEEEEIKGLFLWGEKGIGKTHLINSILNVMREKKGEEEICNFSYIYNYYNKNNQIEEEINNKKNPILLIIDDFQNVLSDNTNIKLTSLISKFFEDVEKKIVLACTKSLSDIYEKVSLELWLRLKKLQEVRVISPGVEGRIRIIRDLCSKEGIFLNEKIEEYLANRIENIRFLQSIIFELGIIDRKLYKESLIERVINKKINLLSSLNCRDRRKEKIEERERKVLELLTKENLKPPQIAEKLGILQVTVYSIINRLKKREIENKNNIATKE